MKLSNPNYLQRLNSFIYHVSGKLVYLGILAFSFLAFMFFNHERLLKSFDPTAVNRYLKSQDILDTENKIKDRIFVSDEEIYIASGYLYANGEDPVSYNFQHPPLVKYLFGFSSKYFYLPLLPNILFAGLLLFEIYILGNLVFQSKSVGLLASLLLLMDPVFKEVSIYALLDLGQMVFILGFIITTFFWKKHWIGQGALLGLAMASKFYSPVIIFLGIIYMYKILTKQFEFKKEALMLFVALVTFATTYAISFVNGDFNFFFYQAKIIKFMIDHNQAIEWGGVIPMFFGGYFFWPILFFVNLFVILKTNIKNVGFLICAIPLFYFLIMSFQLPFTRYFILILPFLYLSLSHFICEKLF